MIVRLKVVRLKFGATHLFWMYALRTMLYAYFLWLLSLDLKVVSAREELFAFPGAPEGGRIPLFAAESGPPLFTVVSLFLGAVWVLLLLQETKTDNRAVNNKMRIFFI